jgi:UbiD family decarboxylase
VAAYVRKSSDTDGPAFLFEDIEGYPGWRLAAGLYSTRRRIAVALDCAEAETSQVYARAVQDPLPPEVGSGRGAPCKEIVWTGEEADLTRLPIVTHSEDDAGPYITSAVDVAKDPDTGVRGLAISRLQATGPRRLGINSPPERRIGRFHLKAEEQGRPLGVAIVVGAGPAVDLASQARVPHTVDKYGIAGRLAGRPVSLVPCETIDVEVPGHAEIVIEGNMLPHVREPEGPFGEVLGTYGLRAPRPVIEVTAITMRRDAMYHTALTGMPTTENHLMTMPSYEEALRRVASMAVPEVVDAAVLWFPFLVAVSIRKRMTFEARNVIHTVLGPTAGTPQPKYCVVVDDDVDVHNLQEVLWAVMTRVQPERDVVILSTMVGAPLDPSAPEYRHSSKMGIDATKPQGAPADRFKRVVVPGADRVRW